MAWRRVSPEVWYGDQSRVAVTAADLADLKIAAAASPRRRARICAHPDPGDALHEMIIVMAGDAYIQPHRHRGRSETFHIIEGRLTIVLFDDTGRVTDRISLGEALSGRAFVHRLGPGVWHTVLPEGDWVVFHEITNGPFIASASDRAPWAPEEKDGEAARLYREGLA